MMFPFRGKEKQLPLFSAADDSRTIVHDFRLRSTQIGFESYRTVDYRLYHKLKEEEMLPRLDEHLGKLFAGEVDDGNGDMLDSLLFGAAREALPDLDYQHCNHADMLRRLIIRRQADREDLFRIREERAAECEEMQADYERTCRMLKNDRGEVEK